MQEIWFGIGHAMEASFNWLLVPFGWLPVIAIVVVMVLGGLYWLVLQHRYTKEAHKRGERP